MKPLIGMVLAVLFLPIFVLVGAIMGVKDCAYCIWRLGDDFYYISKVKFWGKYMPSYRKRKDFK